MPMRRIKPKRGVSSAKCSTGRRIMVRGGRCAGPILNRLTVVWVQRNGTPFDTTGFFARLFRGNTLVQTAAFDRFGVVRFKQVRTLTTVPYTIRVVNRDGVLFRTRTIPAGVEVFAIVG